MQLRNILIVWLLNGIWHGASWNFLLWGLYFGFILILEKWWVLKQLDRMPRWIRHAYAILLILIGWVLFAFEELPKVGSYLQAMIGMAGRPLWDDATLYFAYTNAILLVVLVLASLPRNSSSSGSGGRRPMLYLAWCGALFFLSVSYLVDATFNPFLYFRF